jgi:DNA-binding response OmpR family regulator
MKKLLLIEDDLGISESLTLYLEQSGFSLCTCTDGADAMSIFDECKPQLVILDLNLPSKNGFEICKEIRDITNTPIIILSARG